MATDQEDAAEGEAADAASRSARRRGRGRGRRAVPGQRVRTTRHGQPVVYVEPRRVRRRRPVPARRAAVHDVRRRDRRRPPRSTCERATIPRRRPLERFEVVANFLSHPRNRRLRVDLRAPRRRPDACQSSSTSTPAELPRARGLRPVRDRLRRPSRPHPDPHARRLGRVTRCARTTRRPASPSRSRATRSPDERPRSTDRSSRRKRRSASSARPTRARRSCSRAAQRGRAHRRRHVARGRSTTR